MTLIIRPGEVINTKSTDLKVGGQVSIGGKMFNDGKIKVFENGKLEVASDMTNTGDLSINDPEKIKEIILESLKTTKSVADFGKVIIEKLFIK